jgi:hypothetical protein
VVRGARHQPEQLPSDVPEPLGKTLTMITSGAPNCTPFGVIAGGLSGAKPTRLRVLAGAANRASFVAEISIKLRNLSFGLDTNRCGVVADGSAASAGSSPDHPRRAIPMACQVDYHCPFWFTPAASSYRHPSP